MALWIDTHVHLDDSRYAEDLDQVLARAREAGVHYFIDPGCDGPTTHGALALAERYPGVIFPAVGVHPHEAKALTPALYDELAALAARPEVIAVGEVGLDYHYHHSPPEVQRQVFQQFIRLAVAVEKPLIIHTREAWEDTITDMLLEGAPYVGGVIHSFIGPDEQAARFVEMGFFLGINGAATFNGTTDLHEVIKNCPLDRMLLETDGPYLTPVPHRGERNEPAYLPLVAQRIADLRGISVDAVAKALRKNSEICFQRKFPDPDTSQTLTVIS